MKQSINQSRKERKKERGIKVETMVQSLLISCLRRRLFLSALFFIMLQCCFIFKASAAGYYAPPATFRPMPWQDAFATFYGDETASETMGTLFHTSYIYSL